MSERIDAVANEFDLTDEQKADLAEWDAQADERAEQFVTLSRMMGLPVSVLQDGKVFVEVGLLGTVLTQHAKHGEEEGTPPSEGESNLIISIANLVRAANKNVGRQV